MRSDKTEALKLRLQGESYSQIQKKLGVPKSTLSNWLSRLQLSDGARNRIEKRSRERSMQGLLKRNKKQTEEAEKRKRNIMMSAMGETPIMSWNQIMILGIALYWAEGHKRPLVRGGRKLTAHPISMTNSDPALIQSFLVFLRKICEVPEEKITANIRIYQHQNEKQLLKFWADATKISTERFQKTYYGVSKSSMGKRPYNILPYGTIQIRVNSTNLFHRIMGWIEGVKKEMLKN